MNPLVILFAAIFAAGVCLVDPIIGVILLGAIWLAREMTKAV